MFSNSTSLWRYAFVLGEIWCQLLINRPKSHGIKAAKLCFIIPTTNKQQREIELHKTEQLEQDVIGLQSNVLLKHFFVELQSKRHHLEVPRQWPRWTPRLVGAQRRRLWNVITEKGTVEDDCEVKEREPELLEWRVFGVEEDWEVLEQVGANAVELKNQGGLWQVVTFGIRPPKRLLELFHCH